ncbi:MAG: 2-hydroxyacyl-CoA dehydratase subunit D [Syntrophales bacterium]
MKSLKEKGGRIIGCFPLYPPLELFHSMGLTPVVLWGLKDSVKTFATADRHLQSYACSVARHLVEFVLSDQGKILDGLFMYNACDTLRNLPEILHCGLEETGRSLPIVKTHIPMAPQEQSRTSGYLSAKILSLIIELEDTFDVVFSPDKFRLSVALYREMRSLCKELERQVARGAISYGRYSRIIQEGCFTTVEHHIDLMRCILKEDPLFRDESVMPSPAAAIIVSGILPPPPVLIDAIENAGFRVVGNDIASQRRSYDYTPETVDNPCSYYVDFYHNHFPCPTLLYSADKRIATIKNLVAGVRAQGFVFIGEKFCEDEYFEIPYLEKILKEMGVATLPLEISIEDDLNSAAFETRLEAFSEMLKS